MAGRPAGTRLTAREREIANLLGLGLTNKEIAVRLKITQRTADTHVQNMLNKLGASNRAQIVALAFDAPPAIETPVRSEAPTPPAARARASYGRLAALAAGAVITVLLLSADRQIGLSPTAATDSTPHTSSSQIQDPFDEPDIDTSVWDVAQGPHLRVFKAGDHLAVYIGADAGNAFQAGVSTVCRLGGDFDAEVSFELVTWPRLNALWVSLMASGTPFSAYRTSRDYSDNYGAYLPPAGREVDARGVAGRLRLSRVGSRWSGYYMAANGWSWITSSEGPTEDVGLSVLVFSGGSPPFGGREALVYFRGFHVTADKVVCP